MTLTTRTYAVTTFAPLPARLAARLAAAAIVLALSSPAARAQNPVTLDGTSGSNSISTTYTLSGDTTFELGFFVDYLIVGGGGGGGGWGNISHTGGGGGAGELKEGTDTRISTASNPIAVGAGGAGGSGVGRGASGQNSSALNLVSLGGGGGGTAGATNRNGLAGGSGGGGGGVSGGNGGSSLAANGGLGSAGGTGINGLTSPFAGGGGGGATQAGRSGISGGKGGDGKASTISGSSVTYAGGGGGGTGDGGAGGGGSDGGNGTANRGGGGGGADGSANGGSGGSGIVILRYAGDATGITGGSTDTSTVPGEAITTFLASGTFAIDFSARLGATLTAGVGGTGNLTFSGPGRLTLAADSSYVGTTSVSAGTLQVGGGGTAGSLGSGAVTNNAAIVFNRSNAIAVANAISGTGSLTQAGWGTLTLSGTNSYSGGTTISAGTLEVTGVLGNGSYVGPIANAGNLLFNSASNQTISGPISGTGTLAKSGAGNLILSAAQTYTGATTVSAGRLSVNAALASTAVTVSGGELGGTGVLAGTVAVQNGGRLAPGNSIGVLTEGTTSFASGATFEYEVDSSNLNDLANAADLLKVNGNLDIAAGTLLEFSDLAGLAAQAFVEDTTVFAMINYSGAWNNGLFTYNGQPLADGSRFSVGSQLWEIDYNYVVGGSNIQPVNFPSSQDTNGFYVAVTAVPEPATFALLAAAAGVAALTRRRK
jgi:autotransporter-associated beta strand protein